MAVDPVVPLVTATELTEFGSYGTILARVNENVINNLTKMATRIIENRTDHRLTPFTNITQAVRAYGVDIEQVGADAFPLDLQGSLGRDQAKAFGVVNLVRDFWLNEYPPKFEDLWTGYSISQIVITRFWGDTQVIPGEQLEGPYIDGHFKVRLGTFLPVGSTVVATYSGGYNPVPFDLKLACILQAIKDGMLGNEPQLRAAMNMDELNAELDNILGGYVRI